MKTLVLDIDDTLYERPLICKMFYELSLSLYKLSLLFERLNIKLSKKAKEADHVIILSGRSASSSTKITQYQLRTNGISYDELLLCPRDKLLIEWKKKNIEELQKKYGKLSWFDDQGKK